MKFTIKKGSVDNRAWGDIEKSAIWQRLKKGLEESAEGVREAIREVYAALKAEITGDLTQADVWGPHHVVADDGTITLSKGGLIAAAGALAGARSEPNLSAEQKRAAARHLLRHYNELDDMEAPENLRRLAGAGEGEMVRLAANVTGEIRVEDIPLAPGVNLAALKAGDDDPLEVAVEIPAGKSRRGWNYLPSALQSIARQVASETANGFLGHQKPEDVDHQFPTPVTHWVGAMWRDGKTYVRGVIDAAAKDLKRWIRAGRVRQVSIFGLPTLRTAGGETEVVDYQLLSIDWTPLDRAGMPTSVVAVGEMDSIVSGGGDPLNNNGGVQPMTLAELIAKLKELKVGARQLAGELGWKLDEVAGEIDGTRWAQIQAGTKVLGEIAALFGLGADAKLDDLVTAVKGAREAQVQAAKADRDRLVDKVIGEMIVAEAARPLVKRMLHVPDGADEAAIKKAVGEMLESEDVKKALGSVFKDVPITPKASGKDRDQTTGLRVKRVAI